MRVGPNGFERRPSPGPFADELIVEVDGVALSGLFARPPATAPQALIVALHGLGMHAGYFDSQSAPGLSLLQLAAASGYAFWAPDRPGFGSSADLPDVSLTLFAQADLLLRAIDVLVADQAVGGGVVLVGHSYGLKVAWTMAARDDVGRLRGVDGASSGVTYGFSWVADPAGGAERRRPPAVDTWGPPTLYPSGARERTSIPAHRDPPVQRAEGPRWPDDIRAMGHRIEVPLRITLGDHEAVWPVSPAHFAELRAVFCNAPELEIAVEPRAAHNLSLGWSGRSYHRKVLDFVERSVSGG